MANDNTNNLLVEIRDTLHRIEQLMLQEVEKKERAEAVGKAIQKARDDYFSGTGRYKVIVRPATVEGTSTDDTPKSTSPDS